MGKRINPATVGAFVLGAIGLILAAVVVFGSGNLFRKTHEYVIYFAGDINGLRVDAPVKFTVIKVRNVSNRTRQLSLTGYIEWVLGDVRPKSAMHVVTEIDPNGGALFAHNAFNPEFALVVWAAWRIGRPVKWTSDRSEAFLCDYQARDLAVTADEWRGPSEERARSLRRLELAPKHEPRRVADDLEARVEEPCGDGVEANRRILARSNQRVTADDDVPHRVLRDLARTRSAARRIPLGIRARRRERRVGGARPTRTRCGRLVT